MGDLPDLLGPAPTPHPPAEQDGRVLTAARPGPVTAPLPPTTLHTPPAPVSTQAPAGTEAALPARTRRTSVAAGALSLLSLALAAFVVNVALLSSVEHARAQRLGYAQLREQLSSVTAPTGQTDGNGRLLALGSPVAYLSAPALGLTREVVFEGTTSSVLAKGPGHRRSTVLPGQGGVSVLYGRAWSYGGPFGLLGSVPRGSEIVVTTGQGEHRYRVTGLRRAGDPVPTAPDATKGQGRLTLVSAAGSLYVPTGALYLDADLVTPAQPAPARALSAAGLLPSEQPLAGDSTAWPGAFLLLQGLALSALGVTYAARRFGGPQAWLLGVPVLCLFATLASREVIRLLPNLL